MAARQVSAPQRRSILKVLMISLLLDLVREFLCLVLRSILLGCPASSDKRLDIVHVHPPALPITTHLLPRQRPIADVTPQPHIPLPQCVQKLFCQAN